MKKMLKQTWNSQPESILLFAGGVVVGMALGMLLAPFSKGITFGCYNGNTTSGGSLCHETTAKKTEQKALPEKQCKKTKKEKEQSL